MRQLPLAILAGLLLAGSGPAPRALPLVAPGAPPVRPHVGAGSAARAQARWCGAGGVAADRPDTVGGRQVHVIYAAPLDQPDNLAGRAPSIVSDLQAVDGWWRAADQGKTLRLDLAGFSGCDSELGRLDISDVRLPHDSAYYSAFPIFPVRSDLVADPLDFSNEDKDYIVYFDGPSDERGVCGRAYVNSDQHGYSGLALVYLQTPNTYCGDDLGGANYKAATAAHEITHMLGAVPYQAPHYCASHTCDNGDDLMYGIYNPGLRRAILDPGRDDYYGHSGSWWDVQDSPFLRSLTAPQYPVTVTVAGSGPGTVGSSEPGLACPDACSSVWDGGAAVTVAARAGDRSRFVGWSGACSGDADCVMTVDGPKAVTATFAAQVTLSVHTTVKERGAAGVVVSRPDVLGEACDECEQDVDKGTALTLSVRPARNSRFLGWEGACSGRASCALTVDQDTDVTALVGIARERLTVRVHGRGSVSSAPAGLSCRSRCSAEFRYGTAVVLRARPEPGWRLAAWSGACVGAGSCAVAMERGRELAARFVRITKA